MTIGATFSSISDATWSVSAGAQAPAQTAVHAAPVSIAIDPGSDPLDISSTVSLASDDVATLGHLYGRSNLPAVEADPAAQRLAERVNGRHVVQPGQAPAPEQTPATRVTLTGTGKSQTRAPESSIPEPHGDATGAGNLRQITETSTPQRLPQAPRERTSELGQISPAAEKAIGALLETASEPSAPTLDAAA